jgi:hypothetical protein
MVRTAMVLCGLLALGMPRCGATGATQTASTESGTSQGSQTEPAARRTATAVVQPQPQPSSALTLIDMLRDPLLWGPDYPVALNAVPAFAKAGEQQVEILPRQVVGRRQQAPGEAERAASVAREAYRNTPPMRIAVVPEANVQRGKLQIAAVLFPEDRRLHVGTPDRDVQYIALNARIDQIEQRWGKAERVTIETLDDGSERRPLELTLYHFANDAIIVVTTNVHSDPRVIDRVFLDTRAVMQAIF